ncbi:MAG TPA: hypothetical protein VH253_16120 [Phycisphaerae bacterium]|nr:hypothetical protein [Phycisphaerae bacterium]
MGARAKTAEVDAGRVLMRLPAAFSHIGLYDVRRRKAYAARNDLSRPAIELHHAELFAGVKMSREAAEAGGAVVKDRYLCFWFYAPYARSGPVLGYPIDWSEHNLLVRLEPRWSYARQALLAAHASSAIDANIAAQVAAAAHLLSLYRAHGLDQALSVHMIGPRAADSLFYAHRWEPKY